MLYSIKNNRKQNKFYIETLFLFLEISWMIQISNTEKRVKATGSLFGHFSDQIISTISRFIRLVKMLQEQLNLNVDCDILPVLFFVILGVEFLYLAKGTSDRIHHFK